MGKRFYRVPPLRPEQAQPPVLIIQSFYERGCWEEGSPEYERSHLKDINAVSIKLKTLASGFGKVGAFNMTDVSSGFDPTFLAEQAEPQPLHPSLSFKIQRHIF